MRVTTYYGSNYSYYILGRIHTAVLLISCEHITTLGMVHTGSYVLSDIPLTKVDWSPV